MTKRAARRFIEIVEEAQLVFGQKGYRATQTADVAREVGMSAGLVYHYFESKEALFHTTLEYALAPGDFVVPDELPVLTPSASDTVEMVRGHIEAWVGAPLVEEALSEEAANTRDELEAILAALYDGCERRRLGADLLERSALDLPDLAALWFGEVRKGHFQNLARYFQLRMDSGHFRALPDASVAARIVIESVVFFARHRHRDPYEKLDDALVRESVIRFALAALVPEKAGDGEECRRGS